MNIRNIFAAFMRKLGYEKVNKEEQEQLLADKDKAVKDAVSALKQLSESVSRPMMDRIQSSQQNGLHDVYIFDFLNLKSQYRFPSSDSGSVFAQGSLSGLMEGAPDSDPLDSVNDAQEGAKNPDEPEVKKIAVKPIDVLNELETMPTPFSLELLDQKISMLEDKSRLIVQHWAKREVDGLLERLQNRKKYEELKEFFEQWANTDDVKIEALLTKHDLVMKTSDIFIPEFPQEAIDKMKAYNEKVYEICQKKAVFYVIATKDMFRDADGKRDPILLVQSPFGFYWQILGAWDKEMLVLSEL